MSTIPTGCLSMQRRQGKEDPFPPPKKTWASPCAMYVGSLVAYTLDSNFNSTLTAARLAQSKGTYDIHTNMMHFPAAMQPTHVRIEQVPLSDTESASDSKTFPDIPPRVARNFLVMDTHMETPPSGISTSAYSNSTTAG